MLSRGEGWFCRVIKASENIGAVEAPVRAVIYTGGCLLRVARISFAWSVPEQAVISVRGSTVLLDCPKLAESAVPHS